MSRQAQPIGTCLVKAEKIVELAQQAGFFYETQSPVEQRRLFDTVLPFDLLSQGNETGKWRGRRGSNPRPPA